MTEENVVVVVGACGLDRLIAVPTYPTPDSKVRTTGYYEYGGGNAANTATAMALLSKAELFGKQHFTVKLCSKIGDDYIAKQLLDELGDAGVDLTSPLFRLGDPGTTTGHTNIIVSDQEKTRTCIHTPGTCGELTVMDIHAVDLDEVFGNVVHLHSDGRHTEASLLLAKEAKRRNITVSADVEKDRKSAALDKLLEIADIVFTNADQIEMYLARLTREFEDATNRRRLKDLNMAAPAILRDADIDFFAHVMKPSIYFSRRYGQDGKLVVITKGSQGALSILTTAISQQSIHSDPDVLPSNKLEISKITDNVDKARIHLKLVDHFRDNVTDPVVHTASYDVHRAGVLLNAKVMDTTGAGDAFIGGYILSGFCSQQKLQERNPFLLQFGCWVGGRKLQGFGATSALPTGTEVDEILGTTKAVVQKTLSNALSSFRDPPPAPGEVPLVESWESFVETSGKCIE